MIKTIFFIFFKLTYIQASMQSCNFLVLRLLQENKISTSNFPIELNESKYRNFPVQDFKYLQNHIFELDFIQKSILSLTDQEISNILNISKEKWLLIKKNPNFLSIDLINKINFIINPIIQSRSFNLKIRSDLLFKMNPYLKFNQLIEKFELTIINKSIDLLKKSFSLPPRFFSLQARVLEAISKEKFYLSNEDLLNLKKLRKGEMIFFINLRLSSKLLNEGNIYGAFDKLKVTFKYLLDNEDKLDNLIEMVPVYRKIIDYKFFLIFNHVGLFNESLAIIKSGLKVSSGDSFYKNLIKELESIVLSRNSKQLLLNL